MPSVSKAQQRFMGLVHAYKKGEVPASKVSKAVKDAAKSMKTKSTKKYASTKHKGLPNKVRQEAEDKLKEIIRMELEACGYTTSAINPEYDLKSPGGTGEEDKELKENVECLCEACQKGYMTHPTRKTKIMFGKRYRNCIKKENVTEDGHTDVASAERKLKIIMKDALETLNQLRTLSNEGELPSWWTDKITLAKDYVSKSRDYIMNPTESVDEFVNEKMGPKELHAYMQYVFSSQFKTPEEKKMKKTLIKKMNVAQKKKGLPLFKESVNEDITSAGYFFLRKAAYSIGIALRDLNSGIKRQNDKIVLNEIDYIYDKVIDMKRMLKNKKYNESVNEGKGVEKILKMASEKSFGKIAGRTVDGMTAGLFKAVYDKAPQNSKDKIDKMSEKQLYVFMGKLWNKFGRQVKLS